MVLGRYSRIAPLFYIMILFLWKFVPLIGGSGPRFYKYEESHGCSDSWFWHFAFLNNFFPWKTASNCLSQTWYLANDLQFFALLCELTRQYYKNKVHFKVGIATITFICFTI